MTGVRLGPFTAHRRTASGEADERVSVSAARGTPVRPQMQCTLRAVFAGKWRAERRNRAFRAADRLPADAVSGVVPRVIYDQGADRF